MKGLQTFLGGLAKKNLFKVDVLHQRLLIQAGCSKNCPFASKEMKHILRCGWERKYGEGAQSPSSLIVFNLNVDVSFKMVWGYV